jgi:WD40 repeat protein
MGCLCGSPVNADHDVSLFDFKFADLESPLRSPMALRYQPFKCLQVHTDTISTIAFSPDGTFIATGALDGKLAVWSSRTGKLIYVLCHLLWPQEQNSGGNDHSHGMSRVVVIDFLKTYGPL